jgi:hypothetical protein
LLLCDVIGFVVAEVAGMLDAGPTAIKGLLQRARAATPVPAARARADAAWPEGEGVNGRVASHRS